MGYLTVPTRSPCFPRYFLQKDEQASRETKEAETAETASEVQGPPVVPRRWEKVQVYCLKDVYSGVEDMEQNEEPRRSAA